MNHLRESKSILREALQSASDQKLVDMLAWAQDGKMDYWNGCACFVGALGADVMHAKPCDGHHYAESYWAHQEASGAYGGLGVFGTRINTGFGPFGEKKSGVDKIRQRRVIAIIKAQIRLRAHAASPVLVTA